MILLVEFNPNHEAFAAVAGEGLVSFNQLKEVKKHLKKIKKPPSVF